MSKNLLALSLSLSFSKFRIDLTWRKLRFSHRWIALCRYKVFLWIVSSDATESVSSPIVYALFHLCFENIYCIVLSSPPVRNERKKKDECRCGVLRHKGSLSLLTQSAAGQRRPTLRKGYDPPPVCPLTLKLFRSVFFL